MVWRETLSYVDVQSIIFSKNTLNHLKCEYRVGKENSQHTAREKRAGHVIICYKEQKI